eukprot:1161731-Pelagomonas_calceolata.AAC.3
MLIRLKAYARRKFLTVNTKKSVIVCFNSKTDNLPPLFYDGEFLPYSNTFRYLGMQFNKHINLHNAAEEALKPCLAGMARVRTFAHQHQITNCFHAYLWLFKAYVIPAGDKDGYLHPEMTKLSPKMDICIQKWRN